MAVDTTSADPTQVMDGLVGAIKSIAADPNYNLLAEVFHEVMHLRTKTAELINSNHNIFEQYWQFRNELEEAQTKLEQAKAALQKELDSKTQGLADLIEAHNSLTIAHEETTAALRDTTAARKKLEADLGTANAEGADLRATIAGLEQELGQLAARLEEQKHVSDMAAEQNTALQASMAERDTELGRVKTELQTTEEQLHEAIARGDGLTETLEKAQTDLTAKTARLTELDSYRVVLKEEPEDAFVKILDNVWTTLFNLVERHFQQDLEDKVLSDTSCWNNLRTADALKGPTQIPLPQTNSPVAKAMRIAAVLSILSRTLHKHLFRPFYLLNDDAELTALLHDIEDDSPAKEAHLRAALLAALPDVQQASAKARAQHVVRDVSWAVQHLLGAIAYDSFCTSLGSACALACSEWQTIQHAQTKIEPYFGPPYDDFDWQALPLPEFDGQCGAPRHRSRESSAARGRSRAREEDKGGVVCKPASPAPSAHVQIGVDVEGEEGNEHGTDDHENGAAAHADLASPTSPTAVDSDDDDDNNDNDDKDDDDDNDDEVDPSDIILVVWPSMVVVENGEQSPITQGLVISKQQASLAYHEVRLARHGRINNKRARAMSIPSHPIVVGKHESLLVDADGKKECV